MNLRRAVDISIVVLYTSFATRRGPGPNVPLFHFGDVLGSEEEPREHLLDLALGILRQFRHKAGFVLAGPAERDRKLHAVQDLLHLTHFRRESGDSATRHNQPDQP